MNDEKVFDFPNSLNGCVVVEYIECQFGCNFQAVSSSFCCALESQLSVFILQRSIIRCVFSPTVHQLFASTVCRSICMWYLVGPSQPCFCVRKSERLETLRIAHAAIAERHAPITMLNDNISALNVAMQQQAIDMHDSPFCERAVLSCVLSFRFSPIAHWRFRY